MSRKLPGSAIVNNSITLTQISGSLNDTTNAAYAQANSARDQANTARSDANTTFATINTTFGTVNTSLGTINTNYQAAYSQANTARDTGNNAYASANLAYTQANNARSDANTTFATLNTTFGTINTSLSTINSSFGTTNTNYQAAYAQANTARDTANNAYNNSNTKLSTSGGSISGDLSITGNLVVQGNATTINVTNLSVNDSMILLATGGSGDSNDIGFIGHIQRGATDTHIGLIRKATENRFYLFDNYEVEPTNNVIDVAGNNFRVGNLRLGIVNANSYVTSAGMDVTGQANAAYGQANTARDTANNAYGSANLAYAQANTARSDANTTFATINTTFATINTTTATMNTATTNRVLKAGDTMTGQLNISSGGLIVTGGNVGIGTSNVQAKLHVVTQSLANVNYNNQGAVFFEASESQVQIISDDGGSHASKLTLSTVEQSTGNNKHWMLDHKGPSLGNRFDISYFTSNSSGNILAPSGAEKLTITNAGNIGIGTATPSAYSGYTTISVNNATNGGVIEFLTNGTVQAQYYADANNAVLGTSASIPLDIKVGNSTRARFDTSGNVGIGTTNAGFKLDILGGASSQLRITGTEADFWLKSTGANSTWRILGSTGGDTKLFRIYDNDNGADRLTINNSGSVGIGTISPATLLSLGSPPHTSPADTNRILNWYTVTSGTELHNSTHRITIGVNSSNTSQPQIVGMSLFNSNSTNNNWSPALLFGGLSTSGNYMNGAAGIAVQMPANSEDTNFRGGDIHFFTQGITNATRGLTSKVIIKNNGDVGIGTTNPGYKLDVNGNVRITTGLAMSAATSTLYNNDGTLSFYATNNGVYLNGAGPNGWLRLNGSGAENFRNCIDIYGSGSDFMLFRAANAEKMRINSTGVGIGTASPSYPLHVWNYNNPTTLCIQRTTVPTMITDAQIAGSTASSTWSVNIQDTSNGSQTWGSPINGAYPTGAIQLQSAAGTGTSIAFWTSTGSTSPTQRMTITPSGYVTNPNQPAFSVYQQGSASKNGTLTYTDSILNRGSCVNLTNGRFTAPVSGAYQISFMGFQDSGSTGVLEIFFYKNGASTGVRAYHNDADGAYGPHQTLSTVLSLTAGDYVTVYVVQGSIHGNMDGYFSGFLIG